MHCPLSLEQNNSQAVGEIKKIELLLYSLSFPRLIYTFCSDQDTGKGAHCKTSLEGLILTKSQQDGAFDHIISYPSRIYGLR